MVISIVYFRGIISVLDPFFLYHGPIPGFYYKLDNQRSQNLGIAKNFEYDAIITGTSLTETFKTSEFDRLFGADAVKLPFSGATFYETRQLIEESFSTGHDPKIILRSLDVNHLAEDPDATREDLGIYPTYLYNDSIVDDYKYVCNIDVLMQYCFPMIVQRLEGKAGGHTSFDD